LEKYFGEVLEMQYYSVDPAKVASGSSYQSLLNLLDQVICVIIKSGSNEELKLELIEKIMSLDDTT